MHERLRAQARSRPHMQQTFGGGRRGLYRACMRTEAFVREPLQHRFRLPHSRSDPARSGAVIRTAPERRPSCVSEVPKHSTERVRQKKLEFARRFAARSTVVMLQETRASTLGLHSLLPPSMGTR